MREIKFRAWDGNKMCFADRPDDEFDAHNLTRVDTDEHKNQTIDYSLALLLGVPLMQYTGLHDKNGREIYEGDIVERTHHQVREDHHDGTYQIIWLHTGFIGKNLDTTRGAMWWHLTKDSAKERETISSFEVIGNVYENPELLTKDAGEDK